MHDRDIRPSARVFQALRRALGDGGEAGEAGAGECGWARPEPERADRTGAPEIVLAEWKSPEQVLIIVETLLRSRERAIVSRVLPEHRAALASGASDYELVERPPGRVVVVARRGSVAPRSGGRVAVLAGGTSDRAAVEEVALITTEMGCAVTVALDLGVAGIHRLIGPLGRALDGGADAIVVVAGMDGALPSVVAGLSPVPVIGLPTSVGYGYGAGGQAALMSMLQTCAPGLTVVNIDNSVGAAVAAARIANAVASARRGG